MVTSYPAATPARGFSDGHGLSDGVKLSDEISLYCWVDLKRH
jgi:hypothetical protein